MLERQADWCFYAAFEVAVCVSRCVLVFHGVEYMHAHLIRPYKRWQPAGHTLIHQRNGALIPLPGV
jgi:hypothetical protein